MRCVLVVALLVSASASSLPTRGADNWSRALERRGIDPTIAPNPLEITPAIESAAREYAGGGVGEIDQLRRLQSALFDPARFNLVYDSDATLTAAEAWESRRGNCVASTSLFIALARARGIKVRAGYMTPRTLGEKRGDLIFLTTHVVAVFQNFDKAVVFDFYRESADPTAIITLIDDYTLAALYLNNRAVSSLSRGDLEIAAKELDAVVRLAPRFAAAYGNFGVLRRRQGDLAGALDAYRHALEIEPRNPSILGNLASLYVSLGREREAKAALDLADLTTATPFTILARGDLEMADGRLDEALKLYKRAARRGPKMPEPHLAIARLQRARGRHEEAVRAADRALRLAPDDAEAHRLRAELTTEGASR